MSWKTNEGPLILYSLTPKLSADLHVHAVGPLEVGTIACLTRTQNRQVLKGVVRRRRTKRLAIHDIDN